MKKVISCYATFFITGMMVLMIGAILPYLMEEAQINYSIAGGFLSAFAIGNLLASFINPFFIRKWGRKKTILVFSLLIPFGLLGITMLPPLPILYLFFVLIGIGRGSVSIFNNAVVNDENPGNPVALNILHTVFALGAFLAPFLTSIYIAFQFSWKMVVYTVAALTLIGWFFYLKMEVREYKQVKEETKSEDQFIYFKSKEFYLLGAILFFYLGVENCVNGWFITYFKSKGIMSEMYATNLVSIVWLFVMFGRIVTAYVSKYVKSKRLILINCIATGIFFLLLISTTNLVMITVAIVCLGFFFAGIYPTCVSEAGALIKGTSSGMSMLLAMAALGGIIAPQIVGIIADSIGLSQAIGFLTISTVLMIVLSLWLQNIKSTNVK